jgi:hypothetical protein
MKFPILIALPLIFSLFLSGCVGKHLDGNRVNDQVNVFGVQFLSDVDHREINGIKAVEEPCLRGYERSFDALDITIGYGFDKKTRKITTRNPATSLFGINPGVAFREGKQKVLQAGFVEFAPPFTFRSNGYTLKFLVDDKDVIFGLTLESLD